MSQVSWTDDDGDSEAVESRRWLFGELVGFHNAVSELQKDMPYIPMVYPDAERVSEFLNRVLNIESLATDDVALREGRWSEVAMAAFREVGVVANAIIDGLSLRPAIEEKTSQVLAECHGEPPEFPPLVEFVVDDFVNDTSDNEPLSLDLLDCSWALGHIRLTSQHLSSDSLVLHPLADKHEFNPLNDFQFGCLVRSLGTISIELASGYLSSADSFRRNTLPKFVPKFTPAKLCRCLDGMSLETLNRYAKLANVKTPDRGGRHFLYDAESVLAICKTIIDSCPTQRFNDAATSLMSAIAGESAV